MKSDVITEKWRTHGAWLLLLATLLGAYRGLLDFDPSSGRAVGSGETEEWLFSPTGGSPVFILCLTAWFLFNRRRQIVKLVGRPIARGLAALLLPLGAGLCIWAYFVDGMDILVPSLMAILLGAGALLGGREMLRTLLFPTFFLALTLYHPPALMNQIVYSMQMITANSSSWLLGLIGIDHRLVGDLIFTPSGAFQVIETCSGLRITETLLMSAALITEMFVRDRRHLFVLLFAAPLVGWICNTVRVVTIVLNPYSEIVGVHTTQGIVMLVVGVLLLAAIDSLLSKCLPPNAPRRLPHRDPNMSQLLVARRLVAVAGIFFMILIGTIFVPTWDEHEDRQPRLFTLSSKLGDWKVDGLKYDRQFLGSVRFTEWTQLRYSMDGQYVDVFLGSDERGSRITNLLSPKTAILSSGTTIEFAGSTELIPGGPRVDELILRKSRDRMLVYHWYAGVESVWVESIRSFMALDQSPFQRKERAVVVRLSTPITTGLADSKQTIHSFLPLLLPELDRLGATPTERISPGGAPRS